jgi:phosphopantetheinyl transferase
MCAQQLLPYLAGGFVNPVRLYLVPEPDIALQVLEEAALPLLSAQEMSRLNTHRLPKGRFTFLFTRLMLRRILSSQSNTIYPQQWQFGRNALGKPVICNPDNRLHFNLSHAGGLLAVVVAEHDVGVDAEGVSRDVAPAELSARYFLAEEHAELLSLPEELRRERFLMRWTLKEACVKASGLGIAKALKLYRILIGDDRLLQFSSLQPDQPSDHWRLWYCGIGEYHVSVAALCAADTSADEDSALTDKLYVFQMDWAGAVTAITPEKFMVSLPRAH